MKSYQQRRDQIFDLFSPFPEEADKISTKSSHQYTVIPQRSKSQYNSMVNAFLRTGEITTLDHEQYFEMMAILKEKRRQLQLSHPHTDSTKIETAIKKLSTLFLEKHLYETKAEHVEAVKIQIDIVKTKLSNVQNRWDSKIDSLKQKRDEDLRKLQNSSDSKLMRYDDSLPNRLPPQYCKYSNDLMKMMTTEIELVKSRRFKEADRLHKQIISLQDKEINDRKKEYFRSFEIGRKGLEEKNKRMYEVASSKWEYRIENATSKARKEIQAIKTAITNLEHKLASIEAIYIGENDPILIDKEVKPFPSTINIYSKTPRKSARSSSDAIRKSNRYLDSRRWP